jgi:hypothetical protein|tara:strand:- start:1054 stop:1356 length:303 start_codon:yes stop_codon:yes gene_type:complete
MEVSSSSVRSLFSLGFSFLVLHRLRGVAHCLPEERNKLPGFATYHDKDVVAEVDELKATVGWLHEKVMRVESRIIELDEDHLECTRSSKSVNVYEDNAAE